MPSAVDCQERKHGILGLPNSLTLEPSVFSFWGTLITISEAVWEMSKGFQTQEPREWWAVCYRQTQNPD